MALNTDAKFEGKLTFAFKNDIRNLGNFCRGTICQENEKDGKLEEELTCRFKIEMRTLMNFNPSTQKSQKFAL